MFRLTIILLFFNIHLYAQTESYLKEVTGPGSVNDIVRLINLKNVKRISIYTQEKDTIIFLGNIQLYENGKCFKKQSIHSNVTYHTYDTNGKPIDEVSFLLNDSANFRHSEYSYSRNGVLIGTIRRDKYGAIIDSVNDPYIYINPYATPRYKGDSFNEKEGITTEYNYNSAGYLTRYFSKGFYLPSSKSREEEKFKGNTLEYTFEYNQENQIKSYNKKLTRKSSVCEVTASFDYISDNIIKVKSDTSIGCKCLFCPDNFIYKIDYY